MTPYNPTLQSQALRVHIRGSKGINTFNAETEIQDDQLTVGNNIDLSTIGKIKKRLGFNQVLDDPGGASVVALHYFNAPNVAERMVHIQGARVYDSTSPLAVSGSWVDIEGADGFTANTYSTDMIIADDRTYITNGTDPVHYHNGAGIIQESDQSVDPPFCKVGAYFKNRLWLANETSRATATGDIATYTATSGDMLKVTLDSGTFDEIDMTGDASIANAAASINAKTGFAAKGLAWVDTDGYLRISSLTVGAGSTVAVADGTGGHGGECEDLFDGATASGTGVSNPEYGYYSNALATETFNRTTQVFKVESGEATEIMAVLPAGVRAPDSLLFFKEDSIHELVIAGATAAYWNLRPIEKRFGCVSYYCAKENAGVIYYFSQTGIRTMGGKYDEIPMSKLVQTTWKTINWDYVTRSRMIIHDNKLRLAVPTGDTAYPDKVLVWDILTETWSVITGWNVGCWGIYRELTAGQVGAFEETLMYGDANDGKVYHCFKSTQFNDLAAAINLQIETKAFDFAEPDLYKRGGDFYLRIITGPAAADTGITVSKSTDGGGYATLNTSANAATTKATSRYPLSSLGRFKNIKFKIQQNATSTQQVVIDGYSVETYLTSTTK